MTNQSTSIRFHVVDALRGFAIVSIMLLHNIEHFDYYFKPTGLPDWMVSLDTGIWDTLFFLFGGKSYAIFALLFGLTFFIQSNNQEKKGKDFRGRFAWRMVLLFAFGIFNSAFYQGDILTLYAAVGVLLIPFAKVNNKVVLAVIIMLILQPLNLYHFITAVQNPDMELANPSSWAYFGKAKAYLSDNSFWTNVVGNLTNGKSAVVLWSWENGRFFHMLALFLTGMLIGRKQLFAESTGNKKFWIKTLIVSSVAFVVLFFIQKNAGEHLTTKALKRTFMVLEVSYTNLAFMLVLVSGFTLLFWSRIGVKVLSVFSPIGKMSLSNYIFQSIIGASLYYGFGLGLYKYIGATYSLLIGVVLAILLGVFCTWWAKRFKHGPLERIWHKLTWINLK
ncbi:DUF418 domain-containing protein [Labilibacter marinus]|uniref:DUF418 domain-containing protein n=1 Tax=Labilibacter marinus TaxID=1477105 RepID=UPI00094FE5A7|nr:DUF418 domain-containing protein [Labilibacter marinus]